MASENENEKRETPDDILAEMRREVGDGEDTYCGKRIIRRMDDVRVRQYCDRVDAAWKREREELELYAASKMLDGATIVDNRKVGNAAAMREAVETALTTIRGVINGTIARTNNSVFDCRDRLKAALSAPPRQCDFGTADDQAKRFKAFCRDRQCGSCYGCPIPKKGFCTLQWAQMPYSEEGGAQ